MKHPQAFARGFYAVPPAERTRKGLRGALPAPFVRLQSQEWLVGSAPSTIGTPNGWFASAFTQGKLYLGTGKHYWVVSVQWEACDCPSYAFPRER